MKKYKFWYIASRVDGQKPRTDEAGHTHNYTIIPQMLTIRMQKNVWVIKT